MFSEWLSKLTASKSAKPTQRGMKTRAPAQAMKPGSAPAQVQGASKGQEGSALPAPVANTNVITSYNQVPTHQNVLTLGSAPFKVDKGMEQHLMALECGALRAIILYDVDIESSKIKPHLAALRAKLTSANYNFDKSEIPTHCSVLSQLYKNTMRNVVDDSGDRNKDISLARKKFEGWVQLAVECRATDLHVEFVSSSKAYVRIRVDGELEPLPDDHKGEYPVAVAMDAVAWAYNMSSSKSSNNQSQFDPNQNLYCMIEPRTIGDKQIALRYQSVRGYQGPKVICRLLNVDVNAPTLTYKELGYAPSQEKLLRECARAQAGFILFAGVTGSGKTTTLKTFIETHPGNGSSAFYSIEDPVEYPLRGVHQIPIQRDLFNKHDSEAKITEVVSSLMRGDPDGVLVGEIRDSATAAAGQQIVETGHFSCGTVHAHLISAILPRLTNDEIGMSREVLTNPNMLSILVYQALVPVLCKYCKLTPDQAMAQASDAQDKEHINSILLAMESRFELKVDRVRFKNMSGCPHCNHRGTYGLTVVAEMMIPDRHWLDLSRQGKDYEAVMYYRQFSDGHFDSEDMTGKTVFEHTLYKVMTQMVDPRVCERFGSFSRFELTPQ